MAKTNENKFYHLIVTRSRVLFRRNIKRYQISDFFLLYQQNLIAHLGYVENSYTSFNFFLVCIC